MIDIVSLILALIGGVLLGGIFFGGLWWTVKKGITATYPSLWFFGSFIVRIGLVGAGFYWIGAGHWQNFLSCLTGFLISRFFLTRYLHAPLNQDFNQETHDAS